MALVYIHRPSFIVSTPTLIFYSSDMDSKSIPEDIARSIVEYIARDRPTLKALASVSKSFAYPCREALFQRLVINFRRRNLKSHISNMFTFLTANPSLRPYIHHLEIADNNVPSAHKCETSAPVIETSTPELYSSYELFATSGPGGIYAPLFQPHSLLPQLLNYLVNLSTISISIKNIRCSWLQFTPALCHSFIRLFRMPGLRKLYIQGLIYIPMLALTKFRDLSELYLKECDIDLVNTGVYASSVTTHCATKKLGDRQGLRRLAVLTIQDLPTWTFGVLLNHWKSHSEPGFIDMSHPRELVVYITTLGDLSLVHNILQTCQETIETLRIHTWGLKLGTGDQPPTPVGILPLGHPVYDWFYHAMESFQLTRAYNLSNLSLSVSFWRNTVFPEANGELEWALQMLRDLPTNPNLKQIIVNIRVGGDYKKDRLAFVDFQRYRGWNGWDIELNDFKWRGVDSFLFIVCSDCGPRLVKGKDDIQTVIARQMPMLMESGKLSVGHAVLGDEGLTDHHVVQWIADS